MKIFYKNKKGENIATAEYSGDSVLIHKGSKLNYSKSLVKLSKSIASSRNNKDLVKDGVLIKDVSFRSLSSAGQFIAGYSVSGYLAWRNEEGKKLIDVIKKK